MTAPRPPAPDPPPAGRGPAGTLVLVAHGTRDPAGEAVLAALARRVRAARPGARVEPAFLEISSPSPERVLAGVPDPVVVPLLLAGGYHEYVDLPAVIARARPGTPVARRLGPDPRLTAVLARRLAAARPAPEGPPRPAAGRPVPGPRPAGGTAAAGLLADDHVILGAAGSSDPSAAADVRAAAAMLAARLGRPVMAAFASAARPSIAEAVRHLRARSPHRVAIATYLLAPGFFHDRMRAGGADLVSAPLGADDALAALVWSRHDEAARAGAPHAERAG